MTTFKDNLRPATGANTPRCAPNGPARNSSRPSSTATATSASKNDNCRIEQKNGSVIREYFGDIRLDRPGHYLALETLCRDIALYTNLFRSCKKLISKELKEGKGVKYRKRYDAPAVQLDRLLGHLPPDDPRVAGYVRQRETVNMVTLRKPIQSQLRKIVREQSLPPVRLWARGGTPPFPRRKIGPLRWPRI